MPKDKRRCLFLPIGDERSIYRCAGYPFEFLRYSGECVFVRLPSDGFCEWRARHKTPRDTTRPKRRKNHKRPKCKRLFPEADSFLLFARNPWSAYRSRILLPIDRNIANCYGINPLDTTLTIRLQWTSMRCLSKFLLCICMSLVIACDRTLLYLSLDNLIFMMYSHSI